MPPFTCLEGPQEHFILVPEGIFARDRERAQIHCFDKHSFDEYNPFLTILHLFSVIIAVTGSIVCYDILGFHRYLQ